MATNAARRAPPSASASTRSTQANGAQVQRKPSLANTPLISEQFKEAFSLLDADADGRISRADLETMLAQLAVVKTPPEIEAMLKLIGRPATTSNTSATTALGAGAAGGKGAKSAGKTPASTRSGAAAAAAAGEVDGITFPAFLTHMSAQLRGVSSRYELRAALASFDESDGGTLDVAELKDLLTTGENALTASEVDKVLHGYVKRGRLDYELFLEQLAGA